MDRRIVQEKLESLRRCVQRIEHKRPDTVEALRADIDLQDILSLNLTRAVQVSVDLAAHLVSGLDVPAPNTMADTFRALAEANVLSEDAASRMVAAVGFRNVAVHAYQSIDWTVVHAICHNHLDDFRTFAETIVRSSSSDQ